jgi:hypothetical protein
MANAASHYVWGTSTDMSVPISTPDGTREYRPFDGFQAERVAAKARLDGAITVVYQGHAAKTRNR